MFNKAVDYFHRKREEKIANSLQPNLMRHDDLYLVEYPKSGITYLCHLLANIEFPEKNREINFFNIHSYIPDIHENRYIADHYGQQLGTRLIKSHASFNGNYRYIIHLVREPIDVMVSYKNYWLSHWQKDIPFSKLIRSWRGIPRWVRHTDSWLNSEVNQRYIPVHFMHLVHQPHDTLKYLYNCFGREIPDDSIKRAVENSSIKKMTASEDYWSYGHRPRFINSKFVGKKIFTKQDVSDVDRNYIMENTAELHDKLLGMCEKYIKE